MIVDCRACLSRGPRCSDCVVSVILGPPSSTRTGHDRRVELDDVELRALRALAADGLVPPLRLRSKRPHASPRAGRAGRCEQLLTGAQA